MLSGTSVTWGEGKGGPNAPPQYFFNLGIVYLITGLNNGKQKIEKRKRKACVLWYQFSPLSNLTPL
jgi:hypothetical protein